MQLHRSKNSSGNTLMVVLFFCVVMGIVLASVLKLISNRYTMTVRSNDWNQAVPVLEAGIEEAMTHLHDDSNNYSANGWSASLVGGQTVYTKQRSFSDGSFYDTTIYVTNAYTPVIYSQGYVPSLLGGNNSGGSKYISRMVMVTTTNPPNLFTKAITTSGSITLNGNVTLVDGYDSRIGGYNILTNRNATGNIASDSMAQSAISIGSASVYGTVVTGPGGTISVNGSGSVGDMSHGGGIQSGFTNNNMNVAFPTNAPPTGTPVAWPAQVTNTTILIGSLTGSPTYYSASTFTSGNMIVSGNVIVYISGNVSLTSHAYIQLMPGATMTMIVGGTVSLAGGGVINGTGLASQFSLVGTSSCTSISYTGGAAFIGTINAPQADVTMAGGADIYGSVVAKSATISGGTGFHYDDALAAMSGLVATGWVEK
ncbi:MAG TPA: hypothetical protein VN873_02590 [Candidatus Angelobacter sp.]|nr:hypothetical protein [Candidatus Angelobacter sp.]